MGNGGYSMNWKYYKCRKTKGPRPLRKCKGWCFQDAEGRVWHKSVSLGGQGSTGPSKASQEAAIRGHSKPCILYKVTGYCVEERTKWARWKLNAIQRDS